MIPRVVTTEPAQSRPSLYIADPLRSNDPPVVRTQDDEMVGDSDAFRYVRFRVDQVAGTSATVLLLGETGTGKDVLAKTIHRQSPRRARPFVVVNCAALSAGLAESELFGHERGAFTGAHAARPSPFELADRGTLFLDEIGELPLDIQPKLLRVLQEGHIQRVGSSREVAVDVRVIAATNRDLAEEVRNGRFREDLFYRLQVFPITMPALRDRKDDIPRLVVHLVKRASRSLGKLIDVIPDSVMGALVAHDWPGNIRELENLLQRAVIMSPRTSLTLSDAWAAPIHSQVPAAGTTLAEVERRHILVTLEAKRWRIEGRDGAAQTLGVKPSTLRSRMIKLGIKRSS